jgi:hypothetical protein
LANRGRHQKQVQNLIDKCEPSILMPNSISHYVRPRTYENLYLTHILRGAEALFFLSGQYKDSLLNALQRRHCRFRKFWIK